MNKLLARLPSLALMVFVLTPAIGISQDIRSHSMGGTSVSGGIGTGGFLSNPALLLEAQRKPQRYHFSFAAQGSYRDDINAREIFSDNENLIRDFESEIDVISQQTLQCIPSEDNIPQAADIPSTVCLNGTQALGNLAAQTATVFNQINGETLDGQGAGALGFAVTHTAIPFSLHYAARITGNGESTITESDIAYAQSISEALADDELTVGEIADVTSISVTGTFPNLNINVDLPDTVLTSEALSNSLVRSQFTLGLASTFTLGGHEIDFGLSPKISNLTAYSLITNISVFDDENYNYRDELEKSESTDTSFTFDIGAAMALEQEGVKVGAVIRNVISESITTLATAETPAYTFDTTPQLITSATYAGEHYQISTDLALNKAKQDNFETQRISLGGEYALNYLSFRGGIRHDFAVDRSATVIAIGFGLPFLDFGVSYDGSELRGAGLQFAFSL